jgi:hypothetical protein
MDDPGKKNDGCIYNAVTAESNSCSVPLIAGIRAKIRAEHQYKEALKQAT